MSESNANRTPQPKENTMTTKLPDWIKHAQRVDRPETKRRYKAEDGPLDGTLVWKGRLENYHTGDSYNGYAIRETSTGDVVGVSELAGLRDLRSVKVGSKVFINPIGKKQTGTGRAFDQFEVFAEQQEALSEPSRGTSGAGAKGGNGSPSGGGAAPSEEAPF
jgi:hypothetical protein